jgi:hypothetical protein
MLYAQYGCGLSAPKGWINFDASPTLLLQRLPLVGRTFRTDKYPKFPPSVRYGDVVKGLPLDPVSCAGIYCSHVLEHLSLEDLRRALLNTARYLHGGGRFRLVIPDLRALAVEYLESARDDAAVTFMDSTRLGRRVRPKRPTELARAWLGGSEHLWMWDYPSIALELQTAGFVNIRRAQHLDSVDPRFCEAEDESRWFNCLGVECMK